MPSTVCSYPVAATDTNRPAASASSGGCAHRSRALRPAGAVLALAPATVVRARAGAATSWCERYRHGLHLEQQGAWQAAAAERRALATARDIAEALDYAHDEGMIHRELNRPLHAGDDPGGSDAS